MFDGSKEELDVLRSKSNELNYVKERFQNSELQIKNYKKRLEESEIIKKELQVTLHLYV